MANFGLLGQTLTLIVICELGVLTNQVAAQTFSVNPKSSVDLTPGSDVYGKLSCTFSKDSASDVIGWVVDNGVRISNGNTKIISAIQTALGPGADAKIQVLELAPESGGQNWVYEMDFFSASEVLNGEYKCQLCTDDTCGTVIAESTAAQVRVEYEPTTPLTCSPTSVTRVTLGDPVTLYCSSDPGAPTVQLEWQRNSQFMSDQSPPVLMGGVLYNNYTFMPGANDDDPGVTYSCVRTGATSTSSRTCTVTTFILVSTPQVSIIPPSEGVTPGSSGTYTCSVTSVTNTPITGYTWIVPNVDSSRLTISADQRSVTIDSITAADHEKTVQCEVTDAQSMTGSGEYFILVQGEVFPSNLPTLPPVIPTEQLLTSTTPIPTSLPSPFPLGAIIAIVIVGFILLCLVLIGIWYFQKKKKRGQHTLPTIMKNDLSPTSASPYNKPYGYPNYDDVKHPDPDVIPKGPNERPVDVDDADWWRGSEAPNDQIPLKQVNIPVQSMGSNARLEDPYKYDPAYDDKADPAELDFKVPLDGGYGDGYGNGDYGYPDDYSKKYNDMRYSEDGFDKQNYSDRVYGDGQQDSYPQGYGDGYNPADTSNYGTVYGDGYDAPAAPYDNGYPDRMPDGSEGYEPPPPEEFNNQAYSGYSAPGDYGRPEDYSGVGDYNQPADYSGQPQDMGYGDVQPAEYDDRPADYDYQNPSSGAVPDGYNEGAYDDQYNAPYDAERIPDGGAPGDYESYNYPPEGEPYGDGYTNEPAAYDGYNNDQSAYNDGYGNDPAAYNDEVGYQPYPDQFDSAGQPQGEPYLDPAEEVSATSNPSYV